MDCCTIWRDSEQTKGDQLWC